MSIKSLKELIWYLTSFNRYLGNKIISPSFGCRVSKFLDRVSMFLDRVPQFLVRLSYYFLLLVHIRILYTAYCQCRDLVKPISFLELTGSLETALISCDGLYKSNLNVSHLFSFWLVSVIQLSFWIISTYWSIPNLTQSSIISSYEDSTNHF